MQSIPQTNKHRFIPGDEWFIKYIHTYATTPSFSGAIGIGIRIEIGIEIEIDDRLHLWQRHK